MKNIMLVSAVLAVLCVLQAQAVLKTFPVNTRLTIIEDGVRTYNHRTQNYAFKVEIISEDEGVKTENFFNNYSFITAQKNERYSVRIHNPLPVRVAVNLSIDGVNSITGKPSGIENGTKWIIEANSYITIPGWQVNNSETRRFFFTDKPKSYNAWQSKNLDRDLTVNCGVIGAAFFWSKKELNDYFDCNPTYRYTHRYPVSGSCLGFKGLRFNEKKSQLKDSCSKMSAPASRYECEQQAGTGMGEKESHPVTLVDFNYDNGMYKLEDAVVVYYDFAKVKNPCPFPDYSYAPEMP